MSLSKSLALTMHGLSCAEVYHPGKHCVEAQLQSLAVLLPSLLTYFAPLVFIPIVRNIKHLGWKDVEESFRMYFSMVGATFVASLLTTGGWCGVRYCLGKFHHWSILFLPTMLGNSAVFLLPEKYAALFANTIVAPILESQFRRDNKWYWRLIGQSRAFRTAMFMAMSAFILDTSSRFRNDVFWFLQSQKYKPIEQNETPHPESPLMDHVLPVDGRVCMHSGSCDNHIKSGFKTYLNIGIVLEAVRILFSNFMLIKSKPQEIFKVFASQVNVRLIAFLVGYATSYRTLGCCTSRILQRPSQKANILAGFLSGLAYNIYPNLTILAHAAAASGKLLWTRYVRQSNEQSTLVNIVHALPVAQLVYMVCIGYAFHIRAFYPHSTPGFLSKTTHYTSAKRFEAVSENIGHILMGFGTSRNR